jgi:hypothetical protein
MSRRVWFRHLGNLDLALILLKSAKRLPRCVVPGASGDNFLKPLLLEVFKRSRTPDLYRVKVEVQQPVIDSKGVNNRRYRQNRNTRRNLLPNCYQNMASGFGGRIVGDRPLCFHQHPTKQDTARNLKSIYHFLLALFTPGRATPRPREQTAQACDIACLHQQSENMEPALDSQCHYLWGN